jgi:hypothetical protein
MKKLLLTAAALLAVPAAHAAIIPVTYTAISNGGPNGPQSGSVATSTATWTYDTVTGDLVSTGDVDNVFNFGPNLVFRHDLTNFAISGAGVASAASYTCTIGAGFAAQLNRNVCAGTNFGPNTTDDSVYDATGTVATLGGDDFLQGQGQTLANVFSLGDRIVSQDGLTLLVRKSDYDPLRPGDYQLTFTAATPIPVPAVAWLFASALGLTGVVARRRKAG